MRKTAAYIVSLIFLFMAGLAILHPGYQAIASWLSPLTGGFIYTIFIVFTLLIANPFKYIAVSMVWILTGLIIGLISQKKLGSSIVALFAWLSMIPTLGIAIYGVYTSLEARGLFTIDSVEAIINTIPNVPADFNFNNLFEIPVVSELVFELIDIIPNLGENIDPMQVMMNLAMPHAIAIASKPVIIIVSAIAGAILGKLVFSKIDLGILPTRKIVVLILIGSMVLQVANPSITKAQPPELSEEVLEMLAALGIDPEEVDPDALAEIGLTIEDLEAIAEIGVGEIDLETLTDMGIDTEIAIAIMMGLSGGMNATEGTGLDLELPVNTDDGIYIELMGGFADNQGWAVAGEALLGSDIEAVTSTASYIQDLAASVILTQKILDPSILYTLPFEGIENYVPFVGIAPEIVAVNLYVGDDIEDATAKSDQLMDEYESMYGAEFSRIIAMQQSFEQDEGASFEIPPFIVCVYYSLNTIDEIKGNMLTGFDDKNGIASSFQEVIEGEPRDIELYMFGQVTPSYLEAFMPLPEEVAMFQDLIDAVLAETYHFAVGAQLIDEAVDSGVFDLVEALDITKPRFSADADIGAMAVIRPNSTDTEPFIKLAINIDQASTEFMFLHMYLNTIMPMDISGGMVPDNEDLQIVLPDYSEPVIDLEKTSQTSGGVETVSITITNDGSSTVTDLELTDAFPEKYDVIYSGSSEESWVRLSPGESVSISYEVRYANPGTYTNMPAVLKYQESGMPSTVVSNIPLATSKNPNGLTLLSENYKATFGLIDLLTGRGNLFQLIPLAFIALIAAVDIFKYFRNRSNGTEPEETPEFFPPGEIEDTSEDPL